MHVLDYVLTAARPVVVLPCGVVEASAGRSGLRASTLPIAGTAPVAELTVGAAPRCGRYMS
jgi:hypothetical protein